MNQPKFKFGDKVLHEGKWFEVGAISYNKKAGDYFYNSEAQIYSWMKESDLELYQEPQKKKRFAYIATNGEIKDFTSEQDKSFNDDEGRLWRRAPEYDIEYPGASV